MRGMLGALYGGATGLAESSSRAMGDESCTTCLAAGVSERVLRPILQRFCDKDQYQGSAGRGKHDIN